VTVGGLAPGELAALLARPVVGRLATVDPDGYPAIVPIWFEWDGSALWIVARERSRYVADIRRDPRVALSVVSPDDPDVRAHFRGRAEIVAGPMPLEGETLALARRLAERHEGATGLAYIESSRSLARYLIRIVPDRVTSWGSPDWHPRYVDRPSEPSPGGSR
jgi:PPOX class probable F420-dependent enzyme